MLAFKPAYTSKLAVEAAKMPASIVRIADDTYPPETNALGIIKTKMTQ